MSEPTNPALNPALNGFYQEALARAQFVAGEHLARAMAKFAAEQVMKFAKAIAHGDMGHREWLRRAAADYVRTGKVTGPPATSAPPPPGASGAEVKP